MSTTTATVTETLTPAARAEEIARREGAAWAQEMIDACHSDEERDDLTSLDLEHLLRQDFGALRDALTEAGLRGQWESDEDRERGLYEMMARAALKALASRGDE